MNDGLEFLFSFGFRLYFMQYESIWPSSSEENIFLEAKNTMNNLIHMKVNEKN